METVIQEVANQLGIAVNQAGQFIAEYLPAYASLQIMKGSIVLATIWMGACVLLALAITFFAITFRQRKSDLMGVSEKRYSLSSFTCDFDDYSLFWAFLFCLVVFIILLVFAAAETCIMLPNIIGWQNYPEAMLIDMALKAVG